MVSHRRDLRIPCLTPYAPQRGPRMDKGAHRLLCGLSPAERSVECLWLKKLAEARISLARVTGREYRYARLGRTSTKHDVPRAVVALRQYTLPAQGERMQAPYVLPGFAARLASSRLASSSLTPDCGGR